MISSKCYYLVATITCFHTVIQFQGFLSNIYIYIYIYIYILRKRGERKKERQTETESERVRAKKADHF